jgi:putative ABC transport system permease protein
MSRLLITRNIERNKLRTFLTVLGIAIGVSAVIGLISISLGLVESTEETINKLGQKMVIVTPGTGEVTVSAMLKEFGLREMTVISRVSGVEHVSPGYFTSAFFEFREKKFTTRLSGSKSEDMYYAVEEGIISLDQGKFYSTGKKVVLGVNAWRDLGRPGLGQTISIEGVKFKVEGILKPIGLPLFDIAVFMPIEEAWELKGAEENTFGSFLVYLAEPEVAERLDNRLERVLGEGEYTVSNNEQLIDQANQMLNIIQGFLLAITSISVIVGSLGVANTMFVSITERIRQIGVMKTIGATNERIASLIIEESIALSFFGGILGIELGHLLGWFISQIAFIYEIPLKSVIPMWLNIAVIIVTVVLGVFSGVLPAIQAAKLDPVEALNI